MLSYLFTVLSLTLVATTNAHPGHSSHDHHSVHPLPGTWYHRRDHPVHDLFKRGVGADGATYPDVGSPTWSAKYPTGTPDSTQIPPEWAAALKAAEDSGKIPNIAHAKSLAPDTSPVYPADVDPLGPEICSATQKCINPGDVWDAPPNMFATSFDDGPLPFSLKLLDFLKTNNEGATHFLIGITMVQNVEPFKATLASGNDFAVHTYTHPYMTTLSNADIVAQLGWTMQIIHDSTGGRVPRFWRPPYGDSDNRVRAIAAEVFGLKTVIWNRDTNDWGIPAGSTTPQAINASYTGWLKGPKTPGLIILEHETSDQSVQAFMDAYPNIKANGWTMKSLASLVDGGTGAYSNVVGDKVTPASILKGAAVVTPSGSGGAGSSSTPKPVSGSSTGSSAPSGSAPTSPAPSNAAAALGAGSWQGVRPVGLAIVLACVAGMFTLA